VTDTDKTMVPDKVADLEARELSLVLGGENDLAKKQAFFRARLYRRLHRAVMEEFTKLERERGFTVAEWARRIHRKPQTLKRWLDSPETWTTDIVSDLFIGMGCEPAIGLAIFVSVPLTAPRDGGRE
jgi:hypothetical protein